VPRAGPRPSPDSRRFTRSRPPASLCGEASRPAAGFRQHGRPARQDWLSGLSPTGSPALPAGSRIATRLAGCPFDWATGRHSAGSPPAWLGHGLPVGGFAARLAGSGVASRRVRCALGWVRGCHPGWFGVRLAGSWVASWLVRRPLNWLRGRHPGWFGVRLAGSRVASRRVRCPFGWLRGRHSSWFAVRSTGSWVATRLVRCPLDWITGCQPAGSPSARQARGSPVRWSVVRSAGPWVATPLARRPSWQLVWWSGGLLVQPPPFQRPGRWSARSLVAGGLLVASFRGAPSTFVGVVLLVSRRC
jgi:hypothetical protein